MCRYVQSVTVNSSCCSGVRLAFLDLIQFTSFSFFYIQFLRNLRSGLRSSIPDYI